MNEEYWIWIDEDEDIMGPFKTDEEADEAWEKEESKNDGVLFRYDKDGGLVFIGRIFR